MKKEASTDMIRELHILRLGHVLFEDVIIPSGDMDTELVMALVSNSATKIPEWKIDYMEMERLRYVYTNIDSTQFIVTMDRQSSIQKVNEALMTIISKFMAVFGEILETHKWDTQDFSGFSKSFRNVVSINPVKVCLAGHGGTGKTTLLRLASEATEAPPQDYIPTFFGDKALLEGDFDPYVFSLFDLGGQDRFVQEWGKIIRSGSMVIIISDSTEDNIEWTKRVAYPILRAELPYARIIAIANKQDLEDALTPEEVGARLGVPAYPMQANNRGFRERWLEILRGLAFETIEFEMVGNIDISDSDVATVRWW
jgi:ADP-ribosylation factor-like protein 1